MVKDDCDPRLSAPLAATAKTSTEDGEPSLRTKSWSPPQLASKAPGKPLLPVNGEPGAGVRLPSVPMVKVAVPAWNPLSDTARTLPSPVVFTSSPSPPVPAVVPTTVSDPSALILKLVTSCEHVFMANRN